MTKEMPARAAPTHQTIINICKFDFAIAYVPSHADLRQTPSNVSKFYTFGTLIVFPKVKVVILPKRE